ncbi:uncharacterized protein LOC108735125 [Agrilus planipennis]|uniref:Uncharacterized protein LOC108735125 n=1 Tax=Agrilus planipennis TaxID=224129 RepID=A0A1W4WQR6_AGRPL|nr:uncharacterized protein LOC108735125 [Agrilus planipennis]
MILKATYSFLILIGVTSVAFAKVGPKVRCSEDTMRVEVPVTATTKRIYLQGLKDYPDPACRPKMDPTNSLSIFELNLKDVFQCGTTRVTNKLTGKQVYYQTIIIENEEPYFVEEMLHVKCSLTIFKNHSVSRRDVLPAGFQEPDEIEITTSFEQTAPEPRLGVGVRQGGKLVTGELNVSPGTPLQMEIFLDKNSAPVYGILVSHMQVTDTKKQEETIIYNGCSVDPYLFENFNTVDGDFLSAKFRAFKFPESTYVQFKGTVNVCLDKCRGIECSDGTIGYGRRKREISSLPPDPNKVFEITITSFIKVDYEDQNENFEELFKNQTKIMNNRKLVVGTKEEQDKRFYKTVVDENLMGAQEPVREEIREQNKLTAIIAESSAPNEAAAIFTLILTLIFGIAL